MVKQTTKILLVEVPELKVAFETNGKEETYSAVRSHYPKQSQLILGGALRSIGNVEIVDMKLMEPEREELFREFPYGHGKIKCYGKGAAFEMVKDKLILSDILCLTSNFTRSSGLVIAFAKYAKMANPKIRIVVGGSDATPRYEHYLRNGADVVVLGEGEVIVQKVVKALVSGSPMKQITGIAYMENGRIECNPRHPLNDRVEADDIPLPAFDLVIQDLRKYTEAFEGPLPENVNTPIGILETSRGCAQACSFCTTPYLRKGYRFMSIGRIREWLEHYRKYGIETLVLMEDNLLSRLDFPDGRQKVIELFDLLRGEGFAWEFGNGLEIGKLMIDGKPDTELIGKLFYHEIKDGKYVGCYRIYVPLESLRREPDKVYRKLRPYDQELEIINAIASTVIPMITFGIIIGRPDDSEGTIELTKSRCLEIKEIVEARGVDAYFTPYLSVLLPGTIDNAKYKHLLKYDMEQYPELFHFHTAAIQTNSFSPEELTVLKRKMELEINGKEATDFWSRTGKYYFKKHKWLSKTACGRASSS